MTETIAQHMTPGPHSVGREQPLRKAASYMREHMVQHLPVLHGGELVGVVSVRDIVLLENFAHVSAEKLTVEDAMTPDPYTVAPETPIGDVLWHMVQHDLGSVIVAEGSQVRGIFTSMDALRLLSEVK